MSDELWPNDNWTRVELYRLVYGHLPTHTSDTITQKTLQTFLEKWRRNDLPDSLLNVTLLAAAVKLGQVMCSAAIRKRGGER